MIFVTVGSVLPFDRLIAAVDDWAASRKRKDVFAQVGRSGIKPKYIEYTKFLEPSEYHRVFAKAQVTVAHAGHSRQSESSPLLKTSYVFGV